MNTIKIQFEAESGAVFTGEGPTLLAAIGNLDAEINRVTSTTLTDDLSFDVNEVLEQLKDGRPYKRTDFSSPEGDFTIELTDH